MEGKTVIVIGALVGGVFLASRLLTPGAGPDRTCPSGQVWDNALGHCVPQQQGTGITATVSGCSVT